MLEVKNLVKKYGGFSAIKDLSFSIKEGEIVGFLGPNGAGKSTTMNIITGYISSTSGTVKIDGKEILEESMEAKKKIGYLPEIPPLYNEMTVKGYLSFVFDLKKIKLEKDKHINEICNLVKISNVSNRIIKNLSKGYKQRVGIAQALLGDPELLIFDEPTVGLDPQQIIEIRNLIKELGKNHTVILSSHILSEIQATCDRVIIINNGKIVTDEKMEDIKNKSLSGNKFVFEIDGDFQKVYDVLKETDGVNKVEKSKEGCFIVECADSVGTRKNIFRNLAKNDFAILSLRSASLNLEEFFLQLIGGDQQ